MSAKPQHPADDTLWIGSSADPALVDVTVVRSVSHKKAARKRPANRNGEKTAMFAGGIETEASGNTNGAPQLERVPDEAH
jgi:hypothetical protein